MRHGVRTLSGFLLVALSAHGSFAADLRPPARAPTRALRRLALDLTGVVPGMDDYARVAGVTRVPEAEIDRMLASEAFVARTVRRHRAILWNNVDHVVVTDHRAALLRTASPDGMFRFWRRRVAVTYRTDAVPCDDTPATFDAAGHIVYRVDAEGRRREGTVVVAPYWEPDRPIKVCAFDAQTAARSPSGTRCDTTRGLSDPGCGCGPNLRWCRFGSDAPVTRALAEDVDRRVADVVRRGRPYAELFLGRTGYVNGPLAYFLRHQTGMAADQRFTPLAYDAAKLPDLAWADHETWRPVALGPEHAGILTSPAYLLRFGDARVRANRFYDAFVCAPFSQRPSFEGQPDENGGAAHPDPQERAGCKGCHQTLDPAAAYWGRWLPGGAGYLSVGAFPKVRTECRSEACRPFYLVDPATPFDAPYVGMLRAFRFVKPEHEAHVQRGPRLLVERTVSTRAFSRCAAARALEGLVGRSLRASEEAELSRIAETFEKAQYDYRALVKAAVARASARPPRRMDIDQLNASIQKVTGGIGWTDHDAGRKTDLWAELSSTLGKPDFIRITREDLSVSATFRRILERAADSVCRRLIERDAVAPPGARVFFIRAAPESWSGADVDADLRSLLLRFHGRSVRPSDDSALRRWRTLLAKEGSARSRAGWRAVCRNLLNDPDFFLY